MLRRRAYAGELLLALIGFSEGKTLDRPFFG
jgi:hypothetical protein